MTTVAAFVGIIVLFSDLALRGLRFGVMGRSGRSKSSNPLAVLFFMLWIITMIFAPLLTRIMAMMISRKREYLADASAAELTRNPLALASALTKLENASAPTKTIKNLVLQFLQKLAQFIIGPWKSPRFGRPLRSLFFPGPKSARRSSDSHDGKMFLSMNTSAHL